MVSFRPNLWRGISWMMLSKVKIICFAQRWFLERTAKFIQNNRKGLFVLVLYIGSLVVQIEDKCPSMGMGIHRRPIHFILMMAKRAIQLQNKLVFVLWLFFKLILRTFPQHCAPAAFCFLCAVVPLLFLSGATDGRKTWVQLSFVQHHACCSSSPTTKPCQSHCTGYCRKLEQLFVSFQEYQKNKKMVPSPCGPKAASAFSLSTTPIAIILLCLSLRSFSNLLFWCSAGPGYQLWAAFPCCRPR